MLTSDIGDASDPTLILFNFMFHFAPGFLFFMAIVYLGSQIVGPHFQAEADAEQHRQDGIRKQEDAVNKRKFLAVKEVKIRTKFDDWLEAEVLRYKIECTSTQVEEDKANKLALLEEARSNNIARIAALHPYDGAMPTISVDDVKKQWDQLRTRVI